MDTEKIKELYMTEYNELVQKYENSGIRGTLDNLNNAIQSADVKSINEYYDIVSAWNILVAKIEDSWLSINKKYPYLHAPSPSIFSIILDQEVKKWKFSAEVG